MRNEEMKRAKKRYLIKSLSSVVISSILLLSSCGGGGSSSDDKEKTWTDSSTNLMWQDEKYTSKEKSAYDYKTNYEKARNWEYAKSYCKNLSLANYNDWYLPKQEELMDLYDKRANLKHDSLDYYWSSSSYAPNTSNAWGVLFSSGTEYFYSKSSTAYVRCVRSKQ